MVGGADLEVIVFSYDRAAQLDALLRSLGRHLKAVDGSVAVLYGTSNDCHESGYQLLETLHPEVRFIREGAPDRTPMSLVATPRNSYRYVKYAWLRRPRSNFRTLLHGALEEARSDFTMFLTDDSVFYREVEIPLDALQFIRAQPEQYSLKLSLGCNVRGVPPSAQRKGELLLWDFYGADAGGDWGYPFSVDGVIYDRAVLNETTRKILFSNPNSLEAFVVEFVRRRGLFSKGMCGAESFLISFGINRVQNVFENSSLGVDPDILNSYFVQGYRLEYVHDERPDLFHAQPHDVHLVHPSGGEHVSILNPRNQQTARRSHKEQIRSASSP